MILFQTYATNTTPHCNGDWFLFAFRAFLSALRRFLSSTDGGSGFLSSGSFGCGLFCVAVSVSAILFSFRLAFDGRRLTDEASSSLTIGAAERRELEEFRDKKPVTLTPWPTLTSLFCIPRAAEPRPPFGKSWESGFSLTSDSGVPSFNDFVDSFSLK